MRRANTLLLLALLPCPAFAVDMDYYTWNAFEETVSAFQRVALVLRDPGFTVFVLVFAVGGILVGGLLVAAKGMRGEQVNPIGFLIPAIIGIALFRGLIWPTGTLYVYDPVRNDTAAVGNVPDAVILMAGILNKMERGVRTIVETASADPAGERSGALRYSLVLNSLNARGTNLSLERNLVNYYLDCGLPSMSLGYNGTSQREVERSSEDLYATFARFAHPSLATYAYTGAGDATTTMPCQTMWNEVLNPVLGGTAGLSEVRDMVCARTGFDMAVPAQEARCSEELRDVSTLFGVTTASDWLPFIRSSQIAVGMTNALRSGDISVQQGAMIDRQVMSEGMGVAEALDRWVPKLKGFMTAAVLGMLPLCLLFVVTPLAGKALQLAAGLFVWLSLWGVCDSIAVTMAADAARDAFDQVSHYGFSHTAFMLSPENAVAALGVFGKARSVALMMSTVLAYGLLHFVGTAFTSVPSNWQQDLGAAGQNAGRTVLAPEERASMLGRLAGAPATEATLQQYGLPAMAGGAAIGGAMAAREMQRIAPYVTPTLNAPPGMGAVDHAPSATASGRSRQESGVDTSGYVNSTVNGDIAAAGEGRSMFGYADDIADQRTAQNLGEIGGRKQVGGEVFGPTLAATQFRSEQSLASALSEQHALSRKGFDGESSGTQTGRLAAGATIADSDLLGRAATRDDVAPGSAEAAELVARQQRTNLAGTIDGASLEESITASRESASRSAAYGQVLAEERMARNIGRTEATSSGQQARAFDATTEAFGKQGQQAGATNQQMRTAAEGTAMEEGGGLARLNRRLARVGVGERLGHSDVVTLLGNLAGIDASSIAGVKRLTTSTEGARQTIAFDADPSNKERVIEALNLDDKTATALRSREGGFRLGVAVNADGSIGYGNIESGGQVYLIDRTNIENSFSEVSRSTLELGGGRAQFENPEQFEKQLDRVFEGSSLYTGLLSDRNDAALAAMSLGLSRYFTERGQSLSGSSSETVQHSFGGGARVGTGLPKGLVPGAASVGVDLDARKIEGDSRGSAIDLQIDYARDAIFSSRASAVAAARAEFGVLSDQNATAFRAMVLRNTRLGIAERLTETRDAALKETHGARAGHDVEPKFAIQERESREQTGQSGDAISSNNGVISR